MPRWLKQPDVAETGYVLPIGYAMFNGTSMASPQAAGAAALLLSAAKATRVDASPSQLRASIYSSARFVKGIDATSQGNGQVDVVKAWNLLRTEPTTRRYTTDAPVCTEISGYLAVPNHGAGVYNRCAAASGGQAVGQAKSYAVKLTRTTGSASAALHRVRIVGNDGTFSAPTAVSLRKGRTSTLTVVAKPRTAGLHSAILQVDDPSTNVVDHVVMLSVITSNDLAAPTFTRTVNGSVERNLVKRHFVTVPEGTKALQVNLSGTTAGSQTRWIAVDPYGVPVDDTATSQCYTNFSDAAACDPSSRAYADPIPGVWELIVESRRTSPTLDNPYTLSASAQGVTVSPETQGVSIDTVTSAPVQWTVSNAFGPVTVTPEGGPLGSSFSDRPSIANGGEGDFEVVVPAGAARLDVSIGNTSDPGADLDLYVLLGDTEVGSSADGDSEESVSIDNPAAGTYTVVVDGYDVPAGSTAYDYRDVFFASSLGGVTVPSDPITLDTGDDVVVNGTVSAPGSAAAGRQLFGEMNVLSPEGAVLGTGTVLVTH